jgi:hypothetical protein
MATNSLDLRDPAARAAWLQGNVARSRRVLSRVLELLRRDNDGTSPKPLIECEIAELDAALQALARHDGAAT